MSIAHCRKNNASNAQYPLLICCHSFSPAVSLKITDRSFRYASHRLWIYSVSLTTLVSIHLLIHLSTHLCHHLRCHHPSLLHSFTPCSKLTFSTNPSHLRLLYLLDCLMITGLDRTYHAHHFIFSFTF